MMRKSNIFKMLSCLLASGMCIQPIISQMNTVYAATQQINNVEEALESLTLREKICQMFISYQYTMPYVDADGNVDTSKTISAQETGDDLRRALEKFPVGGILYDASSMSTRTQLQNLISTASSYSKIPLIFSVDEEGGRVARIGNTIGYHIGSVKTFEAMGTYASQGTSVSYNNANIIGQNIKSYGFNLDFAPVADTNSNPASTVIGTRAYSTDFAEAAELVGSAVLGFKAAGVGTTLKHFPGHGDVSGDTHQGTVVAYKDFNTIRQQELQPFRAGIKNGTDAVMIAHITMDEVGVPSLFSKELVTNMLQEEMGFEGLVVSDGLGMKAITDAYKSDEIVIKGINAGVDVFLCIEDLPLAIETIEQAVLDGTISEERIDQSVRKILEFKKNHQ